MSKTVLIISASPRARGNSNLLCDEFRRGAEAAGHRVEKIRLVEQTINYCTGCCACIAIPGDCAQQDDMNEIYPRLVSADVLVLATPVYFQAMNGQLKTFIDRVCPVYQQIRDKEIYFVIAAAGGDSVVERTVQSLRLFTDCLPRARERGTLAVTGVWDEAAVQATPVFEKAYAMGRDV